MSHLELRILKKKKSQRSLVWSNIYHTLRINNKEKKKGEREEEEGKNTKSRRKK